MGPSSRSGTPRLTLLIVACVLSLAPCPRSSRAADSFVNFESEPVRPLALAPARDRLFAVNTPDNRLAIYDVTASGLVLAAEVPVGLEPIAVAARADGAGGVEAWVVNHLSDSVSVVAVDDETPALSRVVRTLLVGDEPRDIVVAGSDHDRVFVSCARRGQNRFPGAEATGPEATTPGVGRADVWVFAADDPSAPLGGTPLSIVQLFGDKPRALAVSPDGARVYAAVFHSGNRTTTINESARAALAPLPPPPPGGLLDGPSTGLIVKFDSAAGRWEDELGRDWNAGVRFTLPDQDVFVIDANTNPPALAPGANAVAGVGTTLFNMAVHPTNGKVYVSNLEARNDVRFVGPQGVTGHTVENRVTIIGGGVSPVHLNQHIDYGVAPGSEEEIGRSLALPLDLAFSADGATLFVAAFGSAKVGAFATADLEAGVVTGTPLAVGRGPGGVVFDQERDRLYVLNALDRTISIVSDASSPTRAVTGSAPLPFDPSPPEVTDGRGFLYDAHLSAHGDAACASCHLFGDVDGLAWDLGDPFGVVEPNPNPARGPLVHTTFHPMKGPMMTQSLRGLAGAGPMHWRGDRTGGNDPGGDPLDEEQAFKKFNVAFVSLQGAASELSDADMQRFTDFALTLHYPPNPIARLDGSLTPSQAAGASLFSTGGANDGQPCTFCHVSAIGTDGFSSDDGEPQTLKIPHFRSQYQKVGMFGVPPNTVLIPPTGPFGDQITGFGFLHDGATATIVDGLKMLVGLTDAERAALADYLMVFDPGLKPAVGQQVTVAAPGVADATVAERIALLLDRAAASDCDLVVKGNRDGEGRGWMYDVSTGQFASDRASEGLVSEAELRAEGELAGAERTYTCVPPASGRRIGLDRDDDGFFDRTELDAGTNPADPNDRPALPGSTVRVRSGKLKLRGTTADPVRRIQFRSSTRRDPRANRILPPGAGSTSDPTVAGATLRVYNSAGMDQLVAVSLPAGGWTAVGAGADVRYRFRGSSGPIRKVVLRQDRLMIRGGGSSWSYVLDASGQGAVAVLFTAGADRHWCAEGGDPIVDTVGRFVAAPNSPPPALCPALP